MQHISQSQSDREPKHHRTGSQILSKLNIFNPIRPIRPFKLSYSTDQHDTDEMKAESAAELDVKPVLADLHQQMMLQSASGKRPRTQLAPGSAPATPRRLKLRKLNAGDAQDYDDYLTAASDTAGSRKATTKTRSAWERFRRRLEKLCAFVVLFGMLMLVTQQPPTRLADDVMDVWHELRQHFQREYVAFVREEESDGSGDQMAEVAVDPFARTMQLLHEQVAHQSAALASLKLALHSSHRSQQPNTSVALIGSSGTGKTLSAGILMRQWQRDGGHVAHFVWQPSSTSLQTWFAQAQTSLSAYDRNLLVVDSIPVRNVGDLLAFHRRLLDGIAAREFRRRTAPLMAVYIVNVPSFGAEDVARIGAQIEDVQRLLRPEGIEPIVFRTLGADRQHLRDCIELERRRRRMAELTEEQIGQIEGDIDVEQSGCKQVGSRLAMYA